jgi:hypothetical protein
MSVFERKKLTPERHGLATGEMGTVCCYEETQKLAQ